MSHRTISLLTDTRYNRTKSKLKPLITKSLPSLRLTGLIIYLSILLFGLVLQVPEADPVNVQNLLETRTLPCQYHCAADHVAHCAQLKGVKS